MALVLVSASVSLAVASGPATLSAPCSSTPGAEPGEKTCSTSLTKQWVTTVQSHLRDLLECYYDGGDATKCHAPFFASASVCDLQPGNEYFIQSSEVVENHQSQSCGSWIGFNAKQVPPTRGAPGYCAVKPAAYDFAPEYAYINGAYAYYLDSAFANIKRQIESGKLSLNAVNASALQPWAQAILNLEQRLNSHPNIADITQCKTDGFHELESGCHLLSAQADLEASFTYLATLSAVYEAQSSYEQYIASLGNLDSRFRSIANSISLSYNNCTSAAALQQYQNLITTFVKASAP